MVNGLNRTSGRVTSDVNNFSGGLNTYANKAFIEDNQLPYAINVTMTEPPILKTRPDRTELHFDLQGQEGIIKEFYACNENEFVAIVVPEDLEAHFTIGHGEEATLSAVTYASIYYIKKNDTTYDYTLVGEMPIAEEYYTTYVRQSTKEYLYISTSSAKGKVVLGNLLVENRYTPLEDGVYGMLCWHKNRLFVANKLTNTVTYSAYSEPDVFEPVDETQLTGDFFVTNGKGNIVALRSFDNKLVIFCEHSVHLLYGDTPDQSFTNQFQLVDFDNALGAVSDDCITIGGGRLFWLGDNFQVYEYTGSYLYMISRPIDSRYYSARGGIDNLFNKYFLNNAKNMKMTSTYDKLYWNLSITGSEKNQFLLVYDIYNHVWWAEDGEFVTITNFESRINHIVMVKEDKTILESDTGVTGNDYYYVDGVLTPTPIPYIFQTKVYGAGSVSGTKSLQEVWFQARANADVYLNEVWQGINMWTFPGSGWTIQPDTRISDEKVSKFSKLGSLVRKEELPSLENYTTEDSEQTALYVEKMYGQRVNAFSLVIKGEGKSEFCLMQRKWRINENI